ncbi:hypothetical protein RRG08_011854 [Elysia crispata]|uniref:Uncharacterized protein n=1 Tax=Elysia crispata TaxID=231223 RepID=A0AAE0ZNB4_9GAST|nr:hypothetical protein RRG08_011854 [Elysia crispata]
MKKSTRERKETGFPLDVVSSCVHCQSYYGGNREDERVDTRGRRPVMALLVHPARSCLKKSGGGGHHS